MRDYNNTVRSAEAAGIEKGRAEGAKERAIEIALKMKKLGMDSNEIAAATGLNIDDILLSQGSQV